ncbi:polymeric immunoglobulin receptor-like protein [Corchorus olitorius]|uniref:Polymeric immunoglobulin receptor-like protein n=1 Tax=Corchorus olitorius TaxID=93759 RepID=A0A1R3KZW8_9ROSI|nr:polymeric immunoglobulin receptor-like protein [Corchorus olitorius]
MGLRTDISSKGTYLTHLDLLAGSRFQFAKGSNAVASIEESLDEKVGVRTIRTSSPRGIGKRGQHLKRVSNQNLTRGYTRYRVNAELLPWGPEGSRRRIISEKKNGYPTILEPIVSYLTAFSSLRSVHPGSSRKGPPSCVISGRGLLEAL